MDGMDKIVEGIIGSINEFMEDLNVSNVEPDMYSPVVAYTVLTIEQYRAHIKSKYGWVTDRWDNEDTEGEVPTHVLRAVDIIGKGYDGNDEGSHYGQDIPTILEDGALRFLEGDDADEIYGGGPDFQGGTRDEILEWIEDIGTPVVWL